MNDDEQQKSPKPENGDHGKRKSSLSCLLMFVFCEIKISPKKRKKFSVCTVCRVCMVCSLQSLRFGVTAPKHTIAGSSLNFMNTDKGLSCM